MGSLYRTSENVNTGRSGEIGPGSSSLLGQLHYFGVTLKQCIRLHSGHELRRVELWNVDGCSNADVRQRP